MRQLEHRRIYATIAGNIGAGKSTLVELLAKEFGWQAYYELVTDHPYLDDYYRDMPRWGFHAQIYFLSQRYEQQQEISDNPLSVCQDRSMYEDYEIFVKGLWSRASFPHATFRPIAGCTRPSPSAWTAPTCSSTCAPLSPPCKSVSAAGRALTNGRSPTNILRP